MISGNITQRGGLSGGLTAGAGGTSDYTDLENKPSINGVELLGNKTSSQLGLNNYNDLENKPSINGVDLIGNKTGDSLNLLNKSDFKFTYKKLLDSPIVGNAPSILQLNDDYTKYDFLVFYMGVFAGGKNQIITCWILSDYLKNLPSNTMLYAGTSVSSGFSVFYGLEPNSDHTKINITGQGQSGWSETKTLYDIIGVKL